mgnify:CR=1 FL=1
MKNKQTPLYRPNSDMDLEGYKDLISYHLTELYHQTDQLDIADARQQDEIDYLRKRVELLETPIQTTMNKLIPKNNNPMNKLKTIEHKLESVFNIMSFIRTVVAVIFLVLMMSCVLVVAPLDSYDKHLIHFHEEGIELPNCEWCNVYDDVEEDDDAE